MNSAPWWFVLVSALVTGGFTLAGSWFTGRSNMKRQREELTHEQVLEREKQLYDRRIELYAELIPLIDRIMGGLWAHQQSHSNPDPHNSVLLHPNEDGDVEADIETVRRLHHQVHVVSAVAVRALVSQFIHEAEQTLTRVDNAQHADSAFAGTDVVFAANHLIWEMRIEIGVARREDLDEFEMRELYY